eukprot:TRINITY_DN4132_c0_g1_i1.p1 TRINITY_DN4132_c0_g1~~TRINITY_DN4132_c0_g1_i1.p1  ORF type:complete len:83 (-),score=4.73 TRINITY_DN4132_c0_g1_i1:11-259(-)
MQSLLSKNNSFHLSDILNYHNEKEQSTQDIMPASQDNLYNRRALVCPLFLQLNTHKRVARAVLLSLGINAKPVRSDLREKKM